MNKIKTITSISFALIVLVQSALNAGNCGKSCCPKCKTPCVLKVEEGTEEKYCWNIEEKTVCIPKVRFSWQWPFQKKKQCSDCSASCSCKTCCNPPKLGRSRVVNTLVKHTYECPACKYSWEPQKCSPCESSCCNTTASVQPAVPANKNVRLTAAATSAKTATAQFRLSDSRTSEK